MMIYYSFMMIPSKLNWIISFMRILSLNRLFAPALPRLLAGLCFLLGNTLKFIFEWDLCRSPVFISCCAHCTFTHSYMHIDAHTPHEDFVENSAIGNQNYACSVWEVCIHDATHSPTIDCTDISINRWCWWDVKDEMFCNICLRSAFL